jgi:hypothetical protein
MRSEGERARRELRRTWSRARGAGTASGDDEALVVAFGDTVSAARA